MWHLGGVDVPLLWLARIGTLYYFAFFWVIMPVIGLIETPRPRPDSIAASVLAQRPGRRVGERICASLSPSRSSFALIAPALADDAANTTDPLPPKEVSFPFEGPFGTYDREQLQRGFQVYKEVCSACHSLNRIAYPRPRRASVSTRRRSRRSPPPTKIPAEPNDKGETVRRQRPAADASGHPGRHASRRRSPTRRPRAPTTTVRCRRICRSSSRRARVARPTSIRSSPASGRSRRRVSRCLRTSTTTRISPGGTSPCRRR